MTPEQGRQFLIQTQTIELGILVVIAVVLGWLIWDKKRKHQGFDDSIKKCNHDIKYMSKFFDTHYKIVDTTITELREDKKRLLAENAELKKKLKK